MPWNWGWEVHHYTRGEPCKFPLRWTGSSTGPGMAEDRERQLLSTDFPPTSCLEPKLYPHFERDLWPLEFRQAFPCYSQLFSSVSLSVLLFWFAKFLSTIPYFVSIMTSEKFDSSSTSNGLWVCLPIDVNWIVMLSSWPESWGILGSHASSQHHPMGSEHLWGLMARADDMPEMLTLDWCFANGQGANVLVSQLLPKRLHKDFYSYFWLLLLYPRVLKQAESPIEGMKEREEKREKRGSEKGEMGKRGEYKTKWLMFCCVLTNH